MNKQKSILIGMILFASLFLTLIVAEVYTTPGFIAEQENIPSEIPVVDDVEEMNEEELKNKIGTFWIVLILAIIGLLFFVLKKKVFKKENKVESIEEPKPVEHQNPEDKEQGPSQEEVEEFVNGLELNDEEKE